MSWQKKARLGIAAFVIVFIAVVAVAMRQRKPAPSTAPLPERSDPKSVVETKGGLNERFNKDGKTIFSVQSESQVVYPDGRTVQRGVTLTLPDRGGRTLVITSKEAENVVREGQAVGTVNLMGDVHVKASDGLDVRADEATYDDPAGTVTIPGKVTFSRGRMTGTGVGATYDKGRDVLWLNDQAHVTVAADEKGEGAMEADATAVGLARADHYVRLTGSAHITAERRDIRADEIKIALTEDNERVQLLELRGNSRIAGGGTGGGPQEMSARDIDLTYREDGLTLQHSRLVENAVVQLPGEGSGTGKRIAGKTIDIALAPDGATVTSLNANENVQVDLPGEGDAPAKRIRAVTLVAGGGDQGLQNATFTGNVDYRETRAARSNVTAVNRTARALKLVVDTKPGLGAIQQATFSGNVHITDGTDVVADAPHAVYFVERDEMDLSPGDAEPGTGPRVSDGRIAVDARTIKFTLGSRKLSAETRVRSSMSPARKGTAPAGRAAAPSDPNQPRVPSMLKQDEPVNVTSNRLQYDGAAGHATYSGNARLWQGDTSIDANTIVLDDKTGNLEGRGTVRTKMQLDEVDAETGKRRTSETIGTSDVFLYEDERRLATYTTSAHMVGPEGDVKGDRIELFLKKDVNELERAEGYGNVEVKETDRTATGNRLTYTAATEEYFMTGTPVVVIQRTPPDCKKTTASSLKFRRAVDTIDAGGVGPFPLLTTKIPCTTERH